jgi:hypothetical protein
MIADRVVAWVKNKLRGRNVYLPTDIAKLASEVNSVHGEFLDHESATRPFFIGWDTVLARYIKDMPPNYTGSYYFEFEKGEVTYRHLSSTPDEEAVRVNLLKASPEVVRRALLQEIFGLNDVSELTLASLDNMMKLQRHPGRELTKKKVASLGLKYFSIPPNDRKYYPSLEEITEANGELELEGGEEEEEEGAQPAAAKKTKSKPAPGAKKAGRPKGVHQLLPGQSSVLTFFNKAPAKAAETTADLSDNAADTTIEISDSD